MKLFYKDCVPYLDNGIRISLNNKLISLPRNQTREITVDYIVKIIQHYSVKSFSISYSNLSNMEALKIFDSLCGNNHIVSIDISNNSLDHNIAKIICKYLKTTKSLKKFNISNNDIGNEGIIYILNDVCFKDTITAMYVNNTNIGCDGIKALVNIVSLEKLTLGSNRISKKEVSILANNLLKDNTVLSKLDLSNNLINDEDIRLLLEPLYTNNTMKKLILYCNEITDEGACLIANFLLTNNVMEKIPLHFNKIGNVGGEAIVKALNSNNNKNIININLMCNEISDESIIFDINKFTKTNMSNKYKLKIDYIYVSEEHQLENIGDNYSFVDNI